MTAYCTYRIAGRRRTPRNLPHLYRRSQGLTLVELLVAMVIGLFLILGMGSIFLMNQQTYRSNSALSNVADGSRIAFDLLMRDIRAAGATGCDSTTGHIANQLGNQTLWWADWDNALHGYAGAQADPAVATGTSEGNRVAGTDSVVVIRAAAPLTSAPQAGNAVVLCLPNVLGNPVTQIVSYTAAVPGVVGQSLLAASDWYIGVNPLGGRSLYRIALVPNAAGGTTEAQEMVRNVTDMQITYLQRGSQDFVDGTAVTDWTTVIAAQVTLTFQSASQNASVNGNQPITRTYAATAEVRNRVN